jgi:peptidyl-prolyl cis-trans isomerase C
MTKDPQLQAEIDLVRQTVLVQHYVRDWVRKNPVLEADVQKEYDRAKAQTGENEYKARHILVETEEQAKALIEDLRKGAKFEELARKNSQDPGSRDRGGDLDWNIPGVFDKQFSDAMVKLEKGRYTEAPVRTSFGFHVIQLDDVRAVRFPSLAEVKPRIEQQLVQDKIEGLVKSLRAKAKVE